METEKNSTISFDVDTSGLTDALALVERIKAAAIEARAALDALGIAPAPVGEFVAGELVADETPGLILTELREQTQMIRDQIKSADAASARAKAAESALRSRVAP